ncbi:MAG: hypothetical protein EOP07_02410 [Proteobacteria bacterium]|nr:MAG: hypothetical protein EOP07_02410 [Pseudomonadota bacterium]
MTETKYLEVERPLSIIKRISWPAVLGGVVVALAVQLLLSLLGLGIGASTIDPLAEQNPLSGLATGTGIWFAITTIISLYAGGWVAGRLAGMNRRLESSLHGVLTWAFTALIAFYFVNSMLTSAVSSMAGVVKSGASMVGQGVASVAPQITQVAKEQLSANGIDISNIKSEATTLLRQTGKPALQPENMEKQADAAATDAGNTAQTAAGNPGATDAELTGLIDRVFSRGEATLNEVDKTALVNVLVARSSMSPEEASQTVDRWQASALVAKQKYDQAKVAAEQKAREIGDVTAKNVSKAALLSFIALVLGAIAATLGGINGMPRNEIVVNERRDNFTVPRPVH